MIDIREHGGIYADGGGGGSSAGANIPGNTTGNIYGFKEDEKMSPYLKNSFNIVAGENIKKGDMIVCKEALFNKFDVWSEMVDQYMEVHKDYTYCNGNIYLHDYKKEKYVKVDVPGVTAIRKMHYIEEFKLMIINDTNYFHVSGATFSPAIGAGYNGMLKGRINSNGNILVKKSDNQYAFEKMTNPVDDIVKGETWPSSVEATDRTIKIRFSHLMESFIYKGKYVYVYPARAGNSGSWGIFGLVYIHFSENGSYEIVYYSDTFFQAGSSDGSQFTEKTLGIARTADKYQSVYSPSVNSEPRHLYGMMNYNGEFVLLEESVLTITGSKSTLHTGDGKLKMLADKRIATPIGTKDTYGTFTDNLGNANMFLFPPLYSGKSNYATKVVVGIKIETNPNRSINDYKDNDVIGDSGLGHSGGTNPFNEKNFIRGIAMENASQGSLVRIQRIW